MCHRHTTPQCAIQPLMADTTDEDDDMCFNKYVCLLRKCEHAQMDSDYVIDNYVYKTSIAVQKVERSNKRKAERVLRGETKRRCTNSSSGANVEATSEGYKAILVADMTEKDLYTYAEKNRRMIVSEYKKNMSRIRRRRAERESKRQQIYCYNCTIGQNDQRPLLPFYDAAIDFFAD